MGGHTERFLMRLTIAVLVTVAVLVAVLAFAAIRTEVTTHHPVSPNRPLLSYGGAPSLDEKIAASAVIARVRFLRAEPVGIHSQTYRAILDQGFHEPLGLGEPLGYVASLEFTFTVLEYLKGTGGTQIKAVAYGAANPRDDDRVTHAAQDSARQKAQALLAVWDDRWVDREALVFLRESATEDHYWLGYLNLDSPDIFNVSVSDDYFKAWLPAVATSTAARSAGSTITAASSGQQRFFLDDPFDVASVSGRDVRGVTRSAAGGTVSVVQVPTASADDVSNRIAEIERWITESGGDEQARACVYGAYRREREIGERKERGEWKESLRYDRRMGSGQPAGTGMYAQGTNRRDRPTAPPPNYEPPDVWYTGPDAQLFGYAYLGIITIVRPLPAAEYRLFYHVRHPIYKPCGYFSDSLRDREEYVFTVSAPARWPSRSSTRTLPTGHRHHRHDHGGHHLVAGGPGDGGPGHRCHRPRPRLHWPGRHHHAVAGRRRRCRGRRHADLDRTHPALERRGQADAARPPARCPHAHAYPHSHANPHTDGYAPTPTDTDRQTGDTVPGQP